MRLPSSLTLPMMDYLEKTYFNRVWNATKDHGQANFALTKAAQRIQIGAVPVSLSVVGLPTTDKAYAVYRVPIDVFGRFFYLKPYQWINQQDVLTNEAILLSAYTASGRMIPGQTIFLRYDEIRGIVLVAIGSGYTSSCAGESYPELFMSITKDTSRKTPVVTHLYQNTASQIVVTAIHDAVMYYPAGTMVYINGWMNDPTNLPVINTNDIIEIVSDPDIIGYCDLYLDDNQTGYYSNKFAEYREILHLPKALNPNNILITHDTLTIGIFDTNSTQGVFGHRVNDHAIEAITHNDFSMSRQTLQAFQQGLNAQSIKVRLYVRYATRPIPLEDDINHLQDLYVLSDEEIKKQLAGLSAHPINEWKAAYLEQSGYLDLVYTFPAVDTADALQRYANAVGYYDVASTLSQAMHYYTYKGDAVIIKKPHRLIGYPCQALVYANGHKLPNYSVIVTDYSTDSIKLSFTAQSYIPVDATMGVYLTEGGSRTPLVFNPTSTNASMILDSEDYTLIKIISYDTAQPVWKDTVTKGYHSLPVSPGDYHMLVTSDNKVTLSVNPSHYGDHFYLVPYGGMNSEVYLLDSYLANKDPIIFPLNMTVSDGTLVPLTGYQALEIYLNGYRLIEDLDYTCLPVMGSNDDVFQTLLEVSNIDYLNLDGSGNILETIVHGDTVVSNDKGYVIQNMMHRDEPPMIWSASCGRAYAHGLLVKDVSEVGEIVTSSQSLDDGVPYLLEWSLPFSVKKLMNAILADPDNDLRTRIFRVLHLIPPTYPAMVSLSHLYALYSPYLAAIVTDVAKGAYQIIDEAKDDQFLKQFSAYALLYPRDPIVSGNNSFIDRRFVTLAAHYLNFVITDAQQMLQVQRLITLTLNPSSLSIEQVLV